MSGTGVSLGLLVRADDKHTANAHVSHIDGSVITSVDLDLDAGTHRVCIQSSDPQALRVLAAALIEAADKGDLLTRQSQAADDERVALNAEAEAEPGYDLDLAEVSS